MPEQPGTVMYSVMTERALVCVNTVMSVLLVLAIATVEFRDGDTMHGTSCRLPHTGKNRAILSNTKKASLEANTRLRNR